MMLDRLYQWWVGPAHHVPELERAEACADNLSKAARDTRAAIRRSDAELSRFMQAGRKTEDALRKVAGYD